MTKERTEEQKPAVRLLTTKMRIGKTQKDRKSGAKKRNAENKEARAAWSRGDEKNFPTHTCNGHNYRRIVTKKKS